MRDMVDIGKEISECWRSRLGGTVFLGKGLAKARKSKKITIKELAGDWQNAPMPFRRKPTRIIREEVLENWPV